MAGRFKHDLRLLMFAQTKGGDEVTGADVIIFISYERITEPTSRNRPGRRPLKIIHRA